MAVGVPKVEVAFTTAPLSLAPVWVDITSYVKSVKTKTGRARELQPFDVSTLALEIDNTDRRFDPFNASGPYYGNLLPNKRVRVTTTLSATTYDTWYGFVDGWPQSYTRNQSVINVTASDAFKLLATMPLPESVYWLEVMADSPLGWWRFKEAIGIVAYDSSVNAADGSCTDAQSRTKGPNYLPEGEPFCDELAGLETVTPASAAPQSPMSIELWHYGTNTNTEKAYVAEGGLAYASGFGDVLALGEGTAFTTDRNKIWWFFDGSSYASNYVVTNNACVWNGKLNHIVVTRNLATIHIYVNGVDQPLTLAGSVLPLSKLTRHWFRDHISSATSDIKSWVSELAIYNTVLSAARVSAHYAAGTLPWNGDTTGARAVRAFGQVSWPSALYDVDTGNNSAGIAKLGGKSCADYLRIIESTEQGQCFVNHRDGGKVRFAQRDKRLTSTRSTVSQYTFSDDSAATYHYEPDIEIVYDERDIVNEVQVKWQEGTSIVSDSTSQTTYGLRALSIDTELPTAAAAIELGDWVLARYKDPAMRIKSLTLDCAGANVGFLPALELRINDRITVVRKPQNTGTAITQDLIVEGIDHDIVGKSRWRTTIRTSSADAGPWFVWGTSKWDTTTRWAY